MEPLEKSKTLKRQSRPNTNFPNDLHSPLDTAGVVYLALPACQLQIGSYDLTTLLESRP